MKCLWTILAALFLAACAPLPEDEALPRIRASKETQELLLYATGVKDAQQKIDALLKRNPRLINTTNDVGETALSRAAGPLNGNPELVRFLLKRGADPNPGPLRGVPLCSAVNARKNGVEILRILLDHGARVNETDHFGRTALSYAVRWDYKAAVDLLLARGAKPSLHEAAALGMIPRMKELLQADPKLIEQPGVFGDTPLYWAALRNQSGAAVLLLKHGADPHRPGLRGITPAQAAFDNGHKALAELLGYK